MIPAHPKFYCPLHVQLTTRCEDLEDLVDELQEQAKKPPPRRPVSEYSTEEIVEFLPMNGVPPPLPNEIPPLLFVGGAAAADPHTEEEPEVNTHAETAVAEEATQPTSTVFRQRASRIPVPRASTTSSRPKVRSKHAKSKSKKSSRSRSRHTRLGSRNDKRAATVYGK